ncbi:hypothetical protein KEM48_011299 [Puccinia striiformis f. sp. tritici PST-130]|nr:hypothetical protein KEM48_011299 [Puccinia striiformis f. sp. tritici PST-130]
MAYNSSGRIFSSKTYGSGWSAMRSRDDRLGRVFLRQAVFDVDYELGYVALKLDLLQHPSIFRKDHGHGL